MFIAFKIQNYLKNQINKEIKIKWPNDIYYRDDKLGGLLIQNHLLGKNIKYSIVGLGININQTHFEGLPNPTSLKLITNLKQDILKWIHGLSQEIDPNESNLQDERNINYIYNKALYGQGQKKKFRVKESDEVFGIIEGVNDKGQLMLKIGESVQCFNHGEITLVLEK